MGRKADIVRLPQSEIEGREYASDKPFDCRYCYYWDVRKSECVRDKCWYLLPFPKKTAEKFDDEGKPNVVTDYPFESVRRAGSVPVSATVLPGCTER